jgi:predicted RNA-binding protein with TRAM domain
MSDDSYEQHFEAEPENPEEETVEPEVEEVEEEPEFEEAQEEQETEDFEAEPETTEEETSDDSGEDEDFDKPVNEGETVEVEVEDLGSKGDGIARKEGFVIFVPGGEVGETYEIEVTSVGRKFAFGEIIE